MLGDGAPQDTGQLVEIVAVLRHVVARAQSEHVDDEVFVAYSRHHDDGQRQPARVQFPEHGDAVHVRKVVVEQQYVVVILREPRQTLLAGVDNIERDIGSGGGEVCLDQVGVGGIVFRVENPECGAHRFILRGRAGKAARWSAASTP